MDDPERRFWIELSYRYARPVAELQEQISSAHFAELLAEERIEPRGGRRGDLQMGIMTATMANCHRSKKSDPFKPADFMPRFGEKKTPKKFDPQALARQMALVANRAKATSTKETQ